MSHVDGKSFEYRELISAEKRIAKLEAALRDEWEFLAQERSNRYADKACRERIHARMDAIEALGLGPHPSEEG